MDVVAGLPRVDRFFLRVSKERGLRPFVAAVTAVSIGLSLGISLIAMWLMGADRAELIATLVIATAVPGVVAPAMASAIGRLLLALDQASSELHALSRVDPLTGVLNRRAFAEDAAHVLREGIGVVLVAMIDVDDFKGVNDRNGHAAGDEVLVHLARALTVAAGDGVVGRFGGDEFALVRRVDPAGAGAARGAIEAACRLGHVVAGVAASCGIALIDPAGGSAAGGAPMSLGEVLTRADHALYGVKRERPPLSPTVSD